jgi:uncharacterized protein DUF6152
MHSTRYLTIAIATFVLAAAVSAFAHHSLTGQFNMDSPQTLTGTISKVEWINPHIYIYLDVKDAGGKVETWALESYPPAFLRRAGLTKASLGIGQSVMARVLQARSSNAKNLAFVNLLTFPDGRQITLGGGDR